MQLQATLILLVISAAILCAQAQAQNYYNYHPPACGRCDFEDFKGNPGLPGPKVCMIPLLLCFHCDY